MVDLGTLGGGYAQAFAINDSGSITGNSQLRSSAIETEALHAFLSPSPLGAGAIGMRDLGTLGGSFSYGMATNANNHVVGYSTVNKVDSRSTETVSNPVFVLNERDVPVAGGGFGFEHAAEASRPGQKLQWINF